MTVHKPLALPVARAVRKSPWWYRVKTVAGIMARIFRRLRLAAGYMNPCLFIGGPMSDIKCRKAANLSPGETLSLLYQMQDIEHQGILAMQPAERDLQCLLDIHHMVKSAGYDSLPAWWKKDKVRPHQAIWKADQGQGKRSL